MIFVTIGTQLPFVRLIEAMAALSQELEEEIIAQIGPDTPAAPGMTCYSYMAPEAFDAEFRQARLIVAHAGIGTVLSAKAAQKPLIIVPRRFALGEHRNDHQIVTAKQLRNVAGIHVVWDVADLRPLLIAPDLAPATSELGPKAAPLLACLAEFIDR